MDIVSIAKTFIGPVVIERIARSLGINSTLAKTAIHTALPAIMAALAGRGESSAGAGSILDAVRGKGVGPLENLDTMFGGADETQHIDAGRRDLDIALGKGEMGPIAKAVSRFTGVEEAKSTALLGMMAPVALGTLGEEVSRNRLDAPGLSHLLSGQRQNIVDALPNGFIDHVPGSNSFDSFKSNFVAGTVSATAGMADGGPPTTTHPVDHTDHGDHAETVEDEYAQPKAKKSGGMLGWLIGLLALLAIGWFVFTNFIAPGDADNPAAIEQSLAPSELGSEISQASQNIQTSLGTITDEASARAALPDLTAASETLGAVQASADGLPDAQKGALGTIVSNAMKTLQPMIDQVRDIPGVGAILGPVLDGIVEKMDALG